MTYSEMESRTNRLANALTDKIQLTKGSRVGILLPNCSEFIESDFAIVMGGFVTVPLNRRLTALECAYILNDAEAEVLIYHSDFSEKLKDIKKEAITVKNFICVGDCPDASDSVYAYENLIKEASEKKMSVIINEHEDVCLMKYTSGTTGSPKGVMLTHRNQRAVLSNLLIDRFGSLDSQASLLCIGPLTHATGFMVLPYYCKGAKLVILDKFDLDSFLQVIEEEKITSVNLVPTMIRMLLDFPNRNKYDLSSLNQINYGASPIPEETLKEAINVFGNIFVQGYGLTEAPLSVTILGKEDHKVNGTPEEIRRLRSVGREMTNMQLRILNELGEDVKPGEVGEIVVSGDNVMKGYWKKPDATAEKIKNGWLHTEDMGWMDSKGYVFLMDRKGDLIISGGFNVYPKEVENIINTQPEVEECAVIGVPDRVWGEAVKAIVKLRPGKKLSEADIINLCRNKIADYKKPRSVEFVDDLPRTAFGKVSKKELKQQYWKGTDREIN